MNAQHVRLPAALLAVLVLLSVVSPLATDLYLSAFPAMADDLATTDASIQLTLTMFLAGLACGQLIFGPMSDRWGRRVPLLIGTSVFVAASITAAVAPTIEVLLVARLVQGISGAAGSVIGRAIIADLAQGQAAAKLYSLVMIVGGIAPVMAPLVGSTLYEFIDWRGVLGVLALCATVMLIGAVTVVKETLPFERRSSGALRGIKYLANPTYIAATATFALSFAVMMGYITASPFVYQDMMGLSSLTYGVVFGVNATGLIIVSAVATKLYDRMSARAVLRLGVTGVSAGALLLAALVVTSAQAGWLSIPLFIAVSSMGFVFGSATSIALDAGRRAAGMASAVVGASQYTAGGIASALVGLGSGANALAVVMVVFAGLAVTAYSVLIRQPVARPSSNVEGISESITA